MTDAERAAYWAEVRKKTGLSRQAFAQRVGLTPGAVWRIENRGVLKAGEEDKLAGVTVTVGTISTAKPVAPASADPSFAPLITDASPAAFDGQPEDVEPQWIEVVSDPTAVALPPALAVSPSALSAADGFERVANSTAATFKDCRRRWWLGFYRGLRPRIESPVGARAIGDRVHRALELWYAPPGTGKIDPRDAIEQLIVADWSALVKASGSEGVSWSTQELFKKDADLQRAMVEGYVKWLAETGADAEYEVVSPEAYLEADLPELGDVKIIAKIDVRVRRTTDGARLWLEHKTVGSFQQKLATINLDEQVLHQTLVERLQPDGEPRVVGVLYNMLKRSRRGTTAKPPFYDRVEVHHNDHEIESYRRRVVATIKDMRAVRAALDAGADHRDVAYPRPSGDCAWKCPFVQVCPMLDDGSRVESALGAYFEQGDPYSYYVSKVSSDNN